MARAFRATTRGYRADLNGQERRLISRLCGDVITLLEQRGDEVEPTDAPATPDQAGQSAAGTDPETLSETDEFAHFRRELADLGSGVNGEGAEPSALPEPRDGVVARLLPSGAEDPEDSAEFRRLTESSLRQGKISDLQTARMLLEQESLVLTEEQAVIFGRALNDVRLTLAVRLGVDTQDDAEELHRAAGQRRAHTPEHFMAEVYTFATWLQETLFSAMLDVLPEQD